VKNCEVIGEGKKNLNEQEGKSVGAVESESLIKR
jgi:hypothetical protein